MSASSIAQSKICVEKLLPQHENHLDELKARSNSADHFDKLRAAFYTSKLWTKGTTIRYGFAGTGNQIPRTSVASIKDTRAKGGGTAKLDPLQAKVSDMSVTDAIRKIVKERIQPIVGVKLVFVDDHRTANIRISFDPDGGAWSLIGTDCLQERNKPTMNLGWFDVATVLHEFGHALGMVHEHQNPSGNPIDWNDPKVYAWASSTQGWDHQTTEKNILSKYSNSQINGSDFDPQSIMLYFFPGTLTNNGVGTHENLRLSGLDVIWLNKMYPQSAVTPAAFYQSTYDMSLNSSVEESKAEEKSFSGGMTRKEVYIIIAVIITLIVIGVGIWWFRTYYRRAGGRYGR